jgi:hypothetical protein
MLARNLALLFVVASSISSYAEPPTPISIAEAKVDTTKLKEWPTNTYGMMFTRDGNPTEPTLRVGQMKFACDIEGDDFLLTNTTRMFRPVDEGFDEKQYVEFVGRCRVSQKNLFSVAKVDLTMVRSDGVKMRELAARVDGKNLEISANQFGRETTRSVDWPDKVLVDVVAFYLVTVLPQAADQRYGVDSYVSLSTLGEFEKQILECAGPDSSTGDANNRWTKWLLYSPDDRAGAVQYWVDADRVLRRVQLSKENRLELEAGEPNESGEE